MIAQPSLIELTADYFACRECSQRYRKGFEYIVCSLVSFVGRDDISAMDAAAINDWLASLKKSPSTRRNYRNTVLALWGWLAQEGLAPASAPSKIKRPNVRAGIPQCWSLDEVRQLLVAAKLLPGLLPNGVSHAAYWRAAIRLAWETGLRRSDVWRVAMADLVRNLLVHVSEKTGQRTVHTLTPETIHALASIDRPLPLQWPFRPNRFNLHFERLVRSAPIRRGTFKWLRRSSGSYVAADYGEAVGAQHLGHTNLATFRKFYDARLVADSRPTPPVL